MRGWVPCKQSGHYNQLSGHGSSVEVLDPKGSTFLRNLIYEDHASDWVRGRHTINIKPSSKEREHFEYSGWTNGRTLYASEARRDHQPMSAAQEDPFLPRRRGSLCSKALQSQRVRASASRGTRTSTRPLPALS